MSDLPNVPTVTYLAETRTPDLLIIESKPKPTLPRWSTVKQNLYRYSFINTALQDKSEAGYKDKR